jgi:hypothetical protein
MLHEHDDRRLMESGSEDWNRSCVSTPRSFRCIYLDSKGKSVVVSYVCTSTCVVHEGWAYLQSRLNFRSLNSVILDLIVRFANMV